MKILLLTLVTAAFAFGVYANEYKDVNLSEQKNMYLITVTFDQVPVYEHRTFKDPFRISIDVKNAQIKEKKIVDMNQPPFKQLRIAQFDNTTVRCVLEMTEERPFTIRLAGNSLQISVEFPNESLVNTIPKFVPVSLVPRDDSVPFAQIKVGDTVKVLNTKTTGFSSCLQTVKTAGSKTIS